MLLGPRHFSRQEILERLPFPSPGGLPGSGIEPESPALEVDSLPLSHQGGQHEACLMDHKQDVLAFPVPQNVHTSCDECPELCAWVLGLWSRREIFSPQEGNLWEKANPKKISLQCWESSQFSTWQLGSHGVYIWMGKAMIFPVVMYGCELDYKESWVPKNWCFWTVVLEKTLESPLD